VRRILAETQVERIRLSSIEPQHVTDELLDVWAGSGGRCLPHFHIPLQSGDDTILRRMGRRYDTAFYAELVARVRRAIPGAAVHADVIVGIPRRGRRGLGGRTLDVPAEPRSGGAAGESLARAIGLVRAYSIDPAAPDRIVGRLLSVVPPVTAPTAPANEPLAESALK
jgi:hypothetical protein